MRYSEQGMNTSLKLSGDHFAACLWKLTKLFDHVDLHLLAPAAHKLGFPAEVFELAINMHTAPRIPTQGKLIGPPIQPMRSVLPGCGLAIASVRIYLRRDMQLLVDKLDAMSWQDNFDPPGTLSTAS